MFHNTKKIMPNVMLVMTLLIAPTLALANTVEKTQTVKSISAQFVQTAKAATITSIAGAKDEFKITLNNVDKHISYFSDRPNRVTGMLPLKQFLKDWNSDSKNSMRNDPPNVAIEGMQVAGEPIQMIGMLSQPVYDQAAAKMTYRFKLLSSPSKELPNKIDLTYTVMFIDSMQIHWGTGPFG